MGCVQQAVLEFDEEVQAPWRPRLVAVPDAEAASVRPLRPHPSRRSPSRVGVCRPAASHRPGRVAPGAGRPRAALGPARTRAARRTSARPGPRRPAVSGCGSRGGPAGSPSSWRWRRAWHSARGWARCSRAAR